MLRFYTIVSSTLTCLNRTMITSKQLIEAGIKPGPLFGRCLKECSTVEEAVELIKANTKEKESKGESFQMVPGTLWYWLCSNECFENMFSREMVGKFASNSEKRRWIEQNAVRFNGRTDWKPNDILPISADGGIDIQELVFFPNGKHRCTFW